MKFLNIPKFTLKNTAVLLRKHRHFEMRRDLIRSGAVALIISLMCSELSTDAALCRKDEEKHLKTLKKNFLKII